MDKQKKIQVQILNAFVEKERGGNPAGVVLDADDLSSKDKLKIASKVGLSETAFVSNSKRADFKLEFFTPSKQIAHCGHATIATFSYLSQIKKLKNVEASKETIDGIRKIKMVDELAFMEQKAPNYLEIKDREDLVLESLGINSLDLIPNAPILGVNTGNSFLIIGVRNKKILKELKPNFELISKVSDELDLIGYYAFALDLEDATRDAHARMFAPRYGIKEESATGMAAGPLAAYIHDILKKNRSHFTISQGYLMPNPSPSLIIVDLEVKDGQIKSLMAGGKGLLTNQIEINI
ncbi:PhzF family phenazine biosynthesis isomerase [Cytophagales bacterium RKSG123]|nr:PhzF family phenazine biosynthesis isomerase [Xanthovirga aplysinae]